jgi:hypothetical protein
MKYFYFLPFILIIINGELDKLFLLKCNDPLVTLYIYSSKINPSWKINLTKLNYFENDQIEMKYSNRIMGYQGFSISCSNDDQIFIHGIISLEKQLLNSGKLYLSSDVIDHVNQYLGQTTISINSFHNRILFTNNNCNHVPIKGPDSVPNYNPLTDNGGCFITKQSINNCYAYGLIYFYLIYLFIFIQVLILLQIHILNQVKIYLLNNN